jgi:hypothetical protein
VPFDLHRSTSISPKMNASAIELVEGIQEFTALLTGVPSDALQLTYYKFEQNVEREAENEENARVSINGSECNGERY